MPPMQPATSAVVCTVSTCQLGEGVLRCIERVPNARAEGDERAGCGNQQLLWHMVSERPTSRHFTFPSGSVPSKSNRCASDAVSLRKSPACKLSFGAWALLSGSSMPSRSHGGPPERSANGPTKPIEPPQPIAAGFLPTPFSRAVLAASNAGPFGSVIHQLTAPCDFTVTLTPHGGSLTSTALTCSKTSSESWSGTIRQLTMAEAV